MSVTLANLSGVAAVIAIIVAVAALVLIRAALFK